VSTPSNNASNLIFPVLVLPVYIFAKSVRGQWRWGSGLIRMGKGYVSDSVIDADERFGEIIPRKKLFDIALRLI
jgi:hypothetical protein